MAAAVPVSGGAEAHLAVRTRQQARAGVVTGLRPSPEGSTLPVGVGLVIQGADVLRLKALVEVAVRVTSDTNGGVPASITRIQRAIDAAAKALMAEVGHADVRDSPSLQPSISVHAEVEVEEVARMAHISERQARRLVSTLGGRKTRAGVWRIDRALIDAHIIERNGRHDS